ncbi:MAG: PAS domain S-box protein [Luteitalea sp.]|nr:PAS domain S-box protein [Luteitalea sp.]
MRKTDRTIALLEATIEASLDGILVLDDANRVVRFNQRFLRMFGVAAEHVAGHSVDDVTARLTREIRPGASGGAADLFATVDGSIVERRSTPVAGVDGTVGRLEIYRDVTEWCDGVRTADQERMSLDAAQEIAQIGSWTWQRGPGEGSVRGSVEACRIFGASPDHFALTSDALLSSVYPDDHDTVRRATAAALAGGESHEIEHRIVRPDREVRWLHVKARVVRNARGTAVRMAGTIQDITERRMLEEQLRQSQKLEAIGRLAGGVAHDLNNSLTAIVGYTELAQAALAETHPAWPDVREIRRAAERAESVMRQLLAFSRKQRLQPRVFQLSRSIESLGRMLARLLGGMEIDTAIDDTLPPIYGDPGQIEQAVINLVVNARDAMGNRGRLSIRLRLAHIDETFAVAHGPMAPGEYVELSVSDTGAGMSLDTQSHMFEPFFTTKEVGKGTGLGLSMVYGTVKQSGGFIFVESEVGRGTTFRIYFPPAADPAERSEAAAAPGPATILVVEDEMSVRTLVVTALSSEGHHVLQAASGTEALEVAAGHDGAIHLLLTDSTMPGMTGAELANEIVRRRGSLHVVIMSGYTVGGLSVSGLAQPLVLLQKPFTPRDLRQKIRDVLAREA